MAPSNGFPSRSKSIHSSQTVLQGSTAMVEGLESQLGNEGNSKIINSVKEQNLTVNLKIIGFIKQFMNRQTGAQMSYTK